MVVGGTRREVEWITRDMGRLCPQAWERFRDGVAPPDRDGDLAEAYRRLLQSRDPQVRDEAARNWSAWEDAHVAFCSEPSPTPGFDDADYRLVFARLVTHYWAHDCFLDDRQVLRDADNLTGIPGVLVHGRRDVSSPLDVPWELSQRWPDSDLIVVDEAAHSTGSGLGEALSSATDRFAADPAIH
jgi:proline iminopeptidase